MASCQHFTRFTVDCDDRRLVEHNALTLHVYKGVGGAKVYCKVACHEIFLVYAVLQARRATLSRIVIFDLAGNNISPSIG